MTTGYLILTLVVGAILVFFAYHFGSMLDDWNERRKSRNQGKRYKEWSEQSAKRHEEFREKFKQEHGRYPTWEEVHGPPR